MAPNSNHNALLILSSLADADRHGYAIKKDIAERTGGEVRLGSTTLYRLLGQLLDAGLIEDAKSRPAPQLDDERRRYFHITAAGRRALAAELRVLERVLTAVRPALAQRAR
jgi:DNA-binding PadR family transcriptional regulator